MATAQVWMVNDTNCTMNTSSLPIADELAPHKDSDVTAHNIAHDFAQTLTTPASTGRPKTAPICMDESLRSQAMTTEELAAFAFTAPMKSNVSLFPVVPVSSNSSECTRESDLDVLSDHEHFSKGVSDQSVASTPVRMDRALTDELNAKVSLRKTSRQGRSTQRWAEEEDTASGAIRLVTGCVPILKDGKILFASASRKSEWILPKGGWEEDETMPESAVRECFEEAGVLGVLGPPLRTIQYETRKAKKRRLELENSNLAPLRSTKAKMTDTCGSVLSDIEGAVTDGTALPPAPVVTAPTLMLSEEAMSRILGHPSKPGRPTTKAAPVHPSDDTVSIASTTLSATYSQVRMTLFPLYVTSVMGVWPESGRFRKAVSIDQALQLLETRPELQAAVREVQERSLHEVSNLSSLPPASFR